LDGQADALPRNRNYSRVVAKSRLFACFDSKSRTAMTGGHVAEGRLGGEAQYTPEAMQAKINSPVHEGRRPH
jgi:hypothetical protein